MIVEIIFLILGFILLIKGADFLVDGACDIAKKFKIPELVIAMTIVSIGTSLPELVVSLQSALEGHSDLAIGNIIGSNISNLFLILGTCAIIRPLVYKKQTKFIENPINLFITLVFLILANGLIDNNMIARVEGYILILGAFMFTAYNLYMAKNANSIAKETMPKSGVFEKKKINVKKCILMIVGGIFLLKIGGDLIVDNCIIIAKQLGLSEKLIGLTIVSLSTSLPELLTSVTAAIKGETDMAIGNILGSQIFNICLIIGLSSAIYPINYSLNYNNDLLLLLFGTFFMCLNPFFGKKDTMTRRNGIVFVLVYAFYIIITIVNA